MSSGPEAGYYADPAVPGYIRYWDGARWVPGTSRPAPDATGSGTAGQINSGAVEPDRADAAAGPPRAYAETSPWQPESTSWSPGSDTPGMQTSAGAAGSTLRFDAHPPTPTLPMNPAEHPAARTYGAAPTTPIPAAPAKSAPLSVAAPLSAAAPPPVAAPLPVAAPPPLAPPEPALATIPAPTPTPAAPIPAARPTPAPTAGPEADSAPQVTIATMVVPSALTGRIPLAGLRAAGAGAGWSTGQTVQVPRLGAYQPSPFANLPNAAGPGPAAAAPDEEPEVVVVHIAPAGARVLARVIDLAVAAICSAPATVTLVLMAHRVDHAYVDRLREQATTTYRTLGMSAAGILLWLAALTALVLTAAALDAYRVGRTGQSSGRRLLGLQVVTAGRARQVGAGAAFVRSLAFWVLAMIPLLDLVALGGVLWGRPYRQGWHEKLSHTMTITV